MSQARQLPQDMDSEQGAISAMMAGGAELIEEAAGVLTEELFFGNAHALMFRGLLELHRQGRPTNFITLTGFLEDCRELEHAGGADYITETFTFAPIPSNFPACAERIRAKAVLRRVIGHCREFEKRAHDEQDNTAGVLEEFQAGAVEIGGLTADAEAMRLVTNAEIIGRLETVEERYKQRGKIAGLSTGIPDLDRMIDGLKGKHVYTIAGRPGMGKSAMGENIWEHVCLNVIEQTGQAAAFFSLEMPREQVIDRALLGRARVNLQRLRDGFMSERDFAALQASALEMAKGKMIIDDTPGLTIAQFRARARRAVLKMKARLIVIDYVQIMKGSSKRAADNRVQELTEIMQGIRETAKQLDVPIIVLAQLNRGAEERVGSVPMMADLKECGAIEEESNLVGLLYRPAYYANSDKKREELANKYNVPLDDIDLIAKLIIAKHRNGPVGDIPLVFHGVFTRFEGVTKKLFSNNPEERQELS